MPDRRRQLLERLADGEFHSGQRLAERLRVSRSAVWKLVRVLRAMDIGIESLPRRGYRLTAPVDLLNREAIMARLPQPTRERLESLSVLLAVDSTNRRLLDASAPSAGRTSVCLAEMQTAGRGRRGRHWVSPFGSGLCLSLSWRFAETPPGLSALSLAAGVAVVHALNRLGATDLGLKWPNDVIWCGRKLAGILIELKGESVGPTEVVIGIGLNQRMPAATRLMLAEQQSALVADLHEMLRDRTPSRNDVAAVLIGELLSMLTVFAGRGFVPFAPTWRALDVTANAPVRVLQTGTDIEGIARGVDDDGALLVEVAGRLERIVSGDVSLRPAATRR